jgi:hypothetical protein
MSVLPAGLQFRNYCERIISKYSRFDVVFDDPDIAARVLFAFVNFAYSRRYTKDRFEDQTTKDVLDVLKIREISGCRDFIVNFLSRMADTDGWTHWRTRLYAEGGVHFACLSWVNLVRDVLDAGLRNENMGVSQEPGSFIVPVTLCDFYCSFLESRGENYIRGPVDQYFFVQLDREVLTTMKYHDLMERFQEVFTQHMWEVTDRYMFKAVRTFIADKAFASLAHVFVRVGMSPYVFARAIDWSNLDWMVPVPDDARHRRGFFLAQAVAAIVRYILAVDAGGLLMQIGFDRLDAILGDMTVAKLVYSHYPAACSERFANPGNVPLQGPSLLNKIDEDYLPGIVRATVRPAGGELTDFVATPDQCIGLIVEHYRLPAP